MGNKFNYGQYAFLGGFGIAVIVGLISNMIGNAMPLVLAILGLFGIIVGLLNISDKEKTAFLVATIALLMVVSSINKVVDNMNAVTAGGVVGGVIGPVGVFIANFLNALMVFVAPAAFVVALKYIYELAKPD